MTAYREAHSISVDAYNYYNLLSITVLTSTKKSTLNYFRFGVDSFTFIKYANKKALFIHIVYIILLNLILLNFLL